MDTWNVKSLSGLKLVLVKKPPPPETFDPPTDSEQIEKSKKQSQREFSVDELEQECDWISWMFQHNYYLVLEKIIFGLPPRSIRSRKEVSRTWCDIIRFYLESTNPRIKGIQDNRIDFEWSHNQPTIKKHLLVSESMPVYDYSQMISDEKSVVVTAWQKKSANPVIFVLDAKDMKLSKVIEPANFYPNFNDDLRDGLSSTLTDDRLFFSFAKDPVGKKCHFVIVAWDRTNNLKYLGVQRAGLIPREMVRFSTCVFGINPQTALKPTIFKCGVWVPFKQNRGFKELRIADGKHLCWNWHSNETEGYKIWFATQQRNVW